MANTNEQFYNDILVGLAEEGIEGKDFDKITNVVSRVLSKYETTLKTTEVTVYSKIPNCVKDYLVVRKIEGISKKSLDIYGIKLKQFFNNISVPFEQISTNDVRKFLFDIQQSTNCTNRTLEHSRGIICTFFKWAHTEGYIPVNPCASLKPIKFIATPRGFLSEIDSEKLRRAAKTKRDKAFVEFLLASGCRISEICSIKKGDLNDKKEEVTVLGKGGKYRKVYLNARAILALQDYLDSRKDDSEYLFVNDRYPHVQVQKANMEQIIKKIGKDAGIEQTVTPHILRHTMATYGIRRGMKLQEVQAILGHAKPETTLIYAEIADEACKESHHKCIT